MKHFRREHRKPQSGSFAGWGRSMEWFETDDQGNTTSQITMFEVGTFLKYDPSHKADGFGGLIDVDMSARDLVQISGDQFHATWVASGASNRKWPSPDDPPATLATHGWELESALDRHLKSPKTFKLPPDRKIKSLKVGNRVKLLVLLFGEDASGRYIQCERLWVGIAAIVEGRFIGALQSRPATSAALLPGDMIVFDAQHIASL